MKSKVLQEYLSQIEAVDYSLPDSEILFHEKEGKPWESRLGGCPYLCSQEDYPMGENGKHMLFMAQINLKEMPRISVLPDHGLLQFFVSYVSLSRTRTSCCSSWWMTAISTLEIAVTAVSSLV